MDLPQDKLLRRMKTTLKHHYPIMKGSWDDLNSVSFMVKEREVHLLHNRCMFINIGNKERYLPQLNNHNFPMNKLPEYIEKHLVE